MDIIKLEDYKEEKIGISYSRDLSSLCVFDIKTIDFDTLRGVVSAHKVCLLQDYDKFKEEDKIFVNKGIQMVLKLSKEDEILLPDECYGIDLTRLSTEDLITELSKRVNLTIER